MAVISKTNMTILADLVGQSYDAILNAYGDYDTTGSVVNLIGRAKTFVRGGAEAQNGVRQVDVGSGGTTLDLIPTTSSSTVTVRKGNFYLDGVEQNLPSNRTFNFASLLPATWWYGAGQDIADDAALQPLAAAAQRCKALIYASNEVVNTTTHPGAGEMRSGEIYSGAHASMILNGTTTDIAAPFITPTAAMYLDKVQLYIGTNTSGTAPNTGLKVYVKTNNAGSPDAIVTTSLKVNDVTAAGGWVDFIFDSAVQLTGGTAYWLVLSADTPDNGDASNLSATINYSWKYDAASSGNGALGLRYNAAGWANVGGGAAFDKLAALRFVEYLKVTYTPVMALGEYNSPGLPDAVAYTDSVAIVDPSVSHVKIALCDLYQAAADPASGAFTATFGTGSVMTDVREIVGYKGLEDDDQMSVIFPAINTSENEFLNIAAEASASPVATDYAALCTGLSSHITSLVSGSTFKTYWKTNEAYLSRSFRKVWEFNQNEELGARFGTFTFSGAGPTAFSNPIDSRWVSDGTYCADTSSGANLEIHMPTGQGNIGTSPTTVYVFGVTTSYTTLNSRATSGVGFLSVVDPDVFSTSASPARVYIWVEKWDGSNGELLKITSITGNMLTLVAEAGTIGSTTLFTHEVGDRVWLVDRIEQAISSTTGVEGANIALTPNITSAKFVSVAYVQPKDASNTATDVIEVRSA